MIINNYFTDQRYSIFREHLCKLIFDIQNHCKNNTDEKNKTICAIIFRGFKIVSNKNQNKINKVHKIKVFI